MNCISYPKDRAANSRLTALSTQLTYKPDPSSQSAHPLNKSLSIPSDSILPGQHQKAACQRLIRVTNRTECVSLCCFCGKLRRVTECLNQPQIEKLIATLLLRRCSQGPQRFGCARRAVSWSSSNRAQRCFSSAHPAVRSTISRGRLRTREGRHLGCIDSRSRSSRPGWLP